MERWLVDGRMHRGAHGASWLTIHKMLRPFLNKAEGKGGCSKLSSDLHTHTLIPAFTHTQNACTSFTYMYEDKQKIYFRKVHLINMYQRYQNAF